MAASNGFFLEELKDRGFNQVIGFEPSVEARQAAHPSVRDSITTGFFEGRKSIPVTTLDLVCAFQTLDHLSDPRAMVQACFDVLSPGGLVYFVMHDVEALQARILRDKSPIIDIEHIYLFNRKTLGRLVTEAGFRVEALGDLKNSYPLAYWIDHVPLPRAPESRARPGRASRAWVAGHRRSRREIFSRDGTETRTLMSENFDGKQLRRIILEHSKRAHVGHIGSALSVADVHRSLVFPNPTNKVRIRKIKNRDRFILSKGHAALALYAALYLRGWMTEQELNTFCGDDTRLGVHPEKHLRGVEFGTGSLGQGISFAAGAALAARLSKANHRVFALLSDAECNEGSLWEAAMFAGHHKLSGLTAIVDWNSQQAFGYTPEVLDFSAMAERWKSFGWDVSEVDGHDAAALARALAKKTTLPHVVLAKTTFGKGVSYMEKQIKWHYWPMSDEDYRQALQDLEKA